MYFFLFFLARSVNANIHNKIDTLKLFGVISLRVSIVKFAFRNVIVGRMWAFFCKFVKFEWNQIKKLQMIMEQKNENQVWVIGFSPTRTSWKVGQAVARGFGKEWKNIDLTYGGTSLPSHFSDKDTLIVCAPVYGGHVAPPALARLDALQGAGARAIVVVTYGNRAYDGALAELAEFVSRHGCRAVGAGAFVGEHSYSVAAYPVAAGRPDTDDLKLAEQLGMHVSEKCGLSADGLIDGQKLTDSGVQLAVMANFRQHLQQAMAQGKTVPSVPEVDAESCSHCGTCVDVCPTQAIVAGQEEQTLADRCIRCCACVKSCPSGARTFDTPFSEALSQFFSTPRRPDLWW